MSETIGIIWAHLLIGLGVAVAAAPFTRNADWLLLVWLGAAAISISVDALLIAPRRPAEPSILELFEEIAE